MITYRKWLKFKIFCHNAIFSAENDHWNTLGNSTYCSSMMDQSLTFQDLNSSIFLLGLSSLANLHYNLHTQILELINVLLITNDMTSKQS